MHLVSKFTDGFRLQTEHCKFDLRFGDFSRNKLRTLPEVAAYPSETKIKRFGSLTLAK